MCTEAEIHRDTLQISVLCALRAFYCVYVCISFLLLHNKLSQAWWHKTIYSLNSSGSQNSQISFTKRKSGINRTTFLPEALGESPFPCLFQLLELQSLAHAPLLHPQSQLCSMFTSLSASARRPLLWSDLPLPRSCKDT